MDSLQESVYGVITLNHVIEHMHEPVDALHACHQALRPGGSIWLATPNIGSLGHLLHRTAWYGLDPPRHLAVFSERGLATALDAAGFARLEWRPSVRASEALTRVRRVLRHRRLAARGEAGPSDGGQAAAPQPERARPARRIAGHRAVHAALRATELAFPGTADELLVRAWRE